MNSRFELETKNKAESYDISNLLKFIKFDELDLSKLQTAIIFYHAEWSIYSIWAIEALFQALKDSAAIIQVIIVDANELNDTTPAQREKCREIFGPFVGGYGEVCWLRSGIVLAHDVMYWNDYESRVSYSQPEMKENALKRIRQLTEQPI